MLVTRPWHRDVTAFCVHRLHLEEETLNVTLIVVRNKGTFGEVSVFCFAQSLAYGATRGEDFDFNPRASRPLSSRQIDR